MLTGQGLGNALREAIEKKGVTQRAVAAHFGVKPPSIQDWLKRGVIAKEHLPELWRYFADAVTPEHWGLTSYPVQVDVAALGTPGAATPAALVVPLLANAGSMGPGADELAGDVMLGSLRLSPEWVQRYVRPNSLTALRFIHAYGESMYPTFTDGDVLLVDTSACSTDIDGVYVLRANGRLYVKRVRQRLDGIYEISSDNPTVKTVDVLDGTHQLDIAGRVIWAWNGRKL